MSYSIDDERALELLRATLEEPKISPNLRGKIQQLLADTTEQEKSFHLWGQYTDRDEYLAARKVLEEYRLKWGPHAPNISYMESLLSFLERPLVEDETA